MKKEGFTLVELVAVIAILASILLIALPVYFGVQKNINQSIYETKIKNIMSKSEIYAEETGSFVFDVKILIEKGYLEADNEIGEYLDPRTKRSMKCDVINVIYENNQYQVKITENETCFSEEELENLYGIAELIIYKDNQVLQEKEGWVKGDPIEIRYQLKENYQSYEPFVEEITWSGEESKSCSKGDLLNCKGYFIQTGEIKTLTIRIKIRIVKDNMEFSNTISKVIRIDNQAPYLVENSIIQNNEVNSSRERKVEFDLSDREGSGLEEYALIKTPNCNSVEYQEKKKKISQSHITEYLENGDYYVCIIDKVGNKNNAEDSQTIHVSNVDATSPVINQFQIKSKENNYHTLETRLIIEASDDGGTNNLKMCISNIGYLQGCSWETYSTAKDWTINGSLDGKERTIYLSIQDAAGNITEQVAKYKPYEECSKTTKTYIDSWSNCATACTQGYQARNYLMKDNFTKKTCSNRGIDKLNTVTFQVANQTVGSNGWYKNLSLKALMPNGTSSAKYCITTAGSCNPATNLNINNPLFNLSSSNVAQKVCVVGTGSNISGCTCCSNNYSVDKTAPIAKISTTCSGSNVIVSATGSNDNQSGIAAYYYSKDNKTWYSSSSTTYTFAGTNSGTFYVKVVDKAGNVSIVVNQVRSCAPVIKRIGEALTGIISPLNTTQIVEFEGQADYTCNGARKCTRGCSTTYCSWVKGRSINISGLNVSYGPFVTLTMPNGKSTGNNWGNGIGKKATVKIDNNTIAFTGGNYSSNTKVSTFGLMLIKVSGNNMWVSENIDLHAGVSKYGMGIEALDYSRGSSTITMAFDQGTKTYYKNCFSSFDMNTKRVTQNCSSKREYWKINNGKWDKEGIVGGSGIPKYNEFVDFIGLDNGSELTLYNNNKFSDSTSTTAGVTMKSGNTNKRIIEGTSWGEYGNAISMGHYGNEKLIIHVGGRFCTGSGKNQTCIYKSYFVFYRNQNGIWKKEFVLAAPGNGTKNYGGELISLNSNTIIFNSSQNGLYLIQY